MPQSPTVTNPATGWKIVMQQRAGFYAVCVSTPNRFGLVLYDLHNLQWRHIQSRLTWVSKECTFR